MRVRGWVVDRAERGSWTVTHRQGFNRLGLETGGGV